MSELLTEPFVGAVIQKDAYTSYRDVVPGHEIALLSVIYGEDALTDIEPTELTMSYATEDLGEEYERLLRKYGSNGDGVAWVEEAFGKPHLGHLGVVIGKASAHYAAVPAKPKAGKRAEHAVAA